MTTLTKECVNTCYNKKLSSLTTPTPGQIKLKANKELKHHPAPTKVTTLTVSDKLYSNLNTFDFDKTNLERNPYLHHECTLTIGTNNNGRKRTGATSQHHNRSASICIPVKLYAKRDRSNKSADRGTITSLI